MMRHDLKSSTFFNSNGLFAKTDRIILRRPTESDVPGFIEAFSSTPPTIAKLYADDSRARELYWQSINEENPSIAAYAQNKTGLLGYCAIEDLGKCPFELGINLMAEHQSQGIGPEAITAFMRGIEKITGPVEFLARIQSGNSRSQRMFRKLGFLPAGIDTFLIDGPGMLAKFEEMQLDRIDDSLCALAEEFGVAPRKLLSHLLVFKRSISQQANSRP